MEVKLQSKELDNLKRFAVILALKKFTFSIGLHENKDKVEEVHIKNLDGTETVEKMTLENILYFIDNGTISTPSKHIIDEIIYLTFLLFLDELIDEVSKYYDINFPLWFDEALKEERADNAIDYITGKFYMFNEFINISIIPQVIKRIKDDSSYVNNVIGNKEDNTWFYDINRIKGYIKSKITVI